MDSYLVGVGAFFIISDLSFAYISLASGVGTAGAEDVQSIGNFVIRGLSANMNLTTLEISTTGGGFSISKGSS